MLARHSINAVKPTLNYRTSSVTSSWTRNPSWLTLPAVVSTENKFVGLQQVWLDSNFIALSAAGDYTVDWGDGTTPQNYSSGTTAYYQYSYSTAGLVGTEATVAFTASTSIVTRANHGYTNNSTISFAGITTTTGIAVGQIYYVVNVTTNTFQVSATSGGSALPLTNDGTGWILPYRQAIVQVYPQKGQTFTSINLNIKHNQTNLAFYNSGFVDVVFAGASLTTMLLGATAVGGTTTNISFDNIEQASVLSTASALGGFCYGLARLQSVVAMNSTAAAMDMSNLFNGCVALQTVPLFNTSNVINMTNMFNNCYSLQTVPLFNTSNVTTMNSLFYNCYSLQTVPLFNTSGVTNMYGMFGLCHSLQTVPLFNTVNVSTVAGMFAGCVLLQTVPLFNTANVTATTSMLANCSSIQTVPLFNTANVSSIAGMFYGCVLLQTVPLFNTVNVTDMSSMFYGCSSLQTVPLFDTSNVTTMDDMFDSCFALQTVPLFNTANVTDTGYMFYFCNSLETVPLFNMANVTIMYSMFGYCSSIQTIPLFNTTKVTDMTGAFTQCPSLQTIAPLVTSAVTASISLTGLNNTHVISAPFSGTKVTVNYANNKLSQSALLAIFQGLGTPTSATSITISGNWGADTPITQTCTSTLKSNTITVANSATLSIGMLVTGTGISNGQSVSFTASGSLVTLSIGTTLANNTTVSFSTITTTTGISIYTIYYVINTSGSTFQLATSIGGSAVTLTNNGTGTCLFSNYIQTIVNGTSVTLTNQAGATGTNTFAFRKLDTSIATLKRWTVSG